MGKESTSLNLLAIGEFRVERTNEFTVLVVVNCAFVGVAFVAKAIVTNGDVAHARHARHTRRCDRRCCHRVLVERRLRHVAMAKVALMVDDTIAPAVIIKNDLAWEVAAAIVVQRFEVEHAFSLPPGRLTHPDTLLADNDLAIAPATFQEPRLNAIPPVFASERRVPLDKLFDVKVGGEIKVLVAPVGPLGEAPGPQLAGNSTSRPSRCDRRQSGQAGWGVIGGVEREVVPHTA
ncbi:hypothetical protein HYQ46_006371 [Verticillium longisporum]|nr:hypothetical protein HYQ46_006371 [Verticillium longisporum]